MLLVKTAIRRRRFQSNIKVNFSWKVYELRFSHWKHSILCDWIMKNWGTKVAQSVGHLTLGFHLGHDLRVEGSSPAAQRGVCLGLSLPLPLLPSSGWCTFSLSLSQTNKYLKKKNEKQLFWMYFGNEAVVWKKGISCEHLFQFQDSVIISNLTESWWAYVQSLRK